MEMGYRHDEGVGAKNLYFDSCEWVIHLGREYREKKGSKNELRGTPSSPGRMGRRGNRRKSQQTILQKKKVIEIMVAKTVGKHHGRPEKAVCEVGDVILLVVNSCHLFRCSFGSAWARKTDYYRVCLKLLIK